MIWLSNGDAIASKPKRILTGDSVEQFDSMSERADGSKIGIGTNKAESQMIKTQFYGSIIAFIFIILSKVIDWFWLARNSTAKDIRDMKNFMLEHTIKLNGIVETLKEIKATFVTASEVESKVSTKVKEEFEYMMKAKDFLDRS